MCLQSASDSDLRATLKDKQNQLSSLLGGLSLLTLRDFILFYIISMASTLCSKEDFIFSSSWSTSCALQRLLCVAAPSRARCTSPPPNPPPPDCLRVLYRLLRTSWRPRTSSQSCSAFFSRSYSMLRTSKFIDLHGANGARRRLASPDDTPSIQSM